MQKKRKCVQENAKAKWYHYITEKKERRFGQDPPEHRTPQNNLKRS